MGEVLYSAPEERYVEHIQRCQENFNLIYPFFEATVSRVIPCPSLGILKDVFLKMILFHDLGKLTKRWQENLGKKLPSHAPLGAAFLYKNLLESLREPISFAVAIHHTDSGLLRDNIERPDVQAILDGIADYEGRILWHERVHELGEQLFPEEAQTLTVYDLRNMATGLRKWALGASLLEQHQRRMQASLAHHILKLCDISASVERKAYEQRDEQDYYGGWLMVKNIRTYVENKKLLKGGTINV